MGTYSFTSEHIAYIGLFIGVLIAFEGLQQILAGHGKADKARMRRLRAIREGRTPDEVLQLLRTPETRNLIERVPVLGSLPRELAQAGVTIAPRVFLALSAAAVVVVFLLASQVFGAAIAGLFALGAGMGVPIMAVRFMRKKRIDAFVAQLPDALDLMMRGLRVGHPLNVTFSNVASMMEEPIATEFAIVADQISYGDNATDALYDLAERVDQEDTHYLAVAIGIQHGTGGNLASMLGVLAKTVRERAMMRRRVSALSSEGRISAIVLSSLPVMIYAVTSITAPDYYGSVKDHPAFTPIALLIIALVVGNALAMKRLVNFKV